MAGDELIAETSVTDDAKQARKSKRGRFLRVAERRTVKVLQGIRVLSRCSNTGAFEYTASDVEKIFCAIQKELDRAKFGFIREKEVKFSLSGEEVKR